MRQLRFKLLEWNFANAVALQNSPSKSGLSAAKRERLYLGVLSWENKG